jgi:hypothetical protein
MSLRLCSLVASSLIVINGCARNEGSEGPVQPPRDGLRGDLLGCYRLYASTSSPLDSSLQYAMPLVRLDSMSLGESGRDTVPGVFRLLVLLDRSGRRIDADDPRRFRFRAWWADSLSDSIRLPF